VSMPIWSVFLSGRLLLVKCPLSLAWNSGMTQEENKPAEVKYLADQRKRRFDPRYDKYPTKPRQKHSHEKKLQVVAEALTPGASVAAVARKHGLNTNLVFSWIRMYENGSLLAPDPRELQRELQKFVMAGLIPKPEQPVEKEPLPEDGVVEIESKLGFKVRLSGRVDRSLLHLVLSEIWKLPS
jgi:transposase